MYISPRTRQPFTRIPNQTPFELSIGDSVELTKKDGTYSNCWVSAKHGVTYKPTVVKEVNIVEGVGGSKDAYYAGDDPPSDTSLIWIDTSEEGGESGSGVVDVYQDGVSVVDENGIARINTSGSQVMFECTRNVTTFEEIRQAVLNGMLPFTRSGATHALMFSGYYTDKSSYVFTAVEPDKARFIYCSRNNEWSNETKMLYYVGDEISIDDLPSEVTSNLVPTTGNVDDVLTKTSAGSEFKPPQGGGGSDIDPEVVGTMLILD